MQKRRNIIGQKLNRQPESRRRHQYPQPRGRHYRPRQQHYCGRHHPPRFRARHPAAVGPRQPTSGRQKPQCRRTGRRRGFRWCPNRRLYLCRSRLRDYKDAAKSIAWYTILSKSLFMRIEPQVLHLQSQIDLAFARQKQQQR